MRRRALATLSLALGLAGVACFGHGAWILAKAELAQVLLERAWQKTLAGGTRVRPWPWADTYPVARLRAPGQDDAEIVLAGATGEALAFGPGHLAGSAPPGAAGNTVLAGHRDTHFEFLRELEPGDLVELATADGRVHRYAVESAEVLHETETEVLEGDDGPNAEKRLTLVTCWPFDALVPGGPLRWVVRARALSAGAG